jgi:hypothetical protein
MRLAARLHILSFSLIFGVLTSAAQVAAQSETGNGYLHEQVWCYLFTHPVDQVGDPSATDDGCTKVHSQAKK